MNFIKALRGLLLLGYYSLFRKAELNIIFPEDNIELNQTAIDLAIHYSEFTQIKRCNLFFIKGSLAKYDLTKIKTDEKCHFNIIEDKICNIRCILKCLSLIRYSQRNLIVSFNYPFKTNNLGLLKKNNLSLRELVCYDIYHLTYMPDKNRN